MAEASKVHQYAPGNPMFFVPLVDDEDPADDSACRNVWVQLAYSDPTYATVEDPGADVVNQ